MRFNVSDKSKILLLVGSFMALGYEACGGTIGLGALQEASGVTKHNILRICQVSASYNNPNTKSVYGDYVAGRMMKTRISFNEEEGWVEISDGNPTPDYQGWCEGDAQDEGIQLAQKLTKLKNRNLRKFSSYLALLIAAAEDNGMTVNTEKNEILVPESTPSLNNDVPDPVHIPVSQEKAEELVNSHPIRIRPVN